jgi:hypothetical protein
MRLALLFLLLPSWLAAQVVPWKQDVISGTDTLTVFGTYLTVTTVKVDSVVKKYTPPPVITGRPYGPSGLLNTPPPYTPFTADPGASSAKPQYLLDNITKARQRGVKFVAALPCGSHNVNNLGNCLVKLPNGTVTFSRQRFDSALATYNTPAMKAAIDSAYKDGTLITVNLMDEPWVKGGGDGNTWGPNGLTRVQADSSCATAKAGAFKNVPVGTSDASPKIWPNTSGNLKVCDVGIAQFSFRYGDPVKWRDTLIVMSTAAGYQSVFSFNWINGGTQDKGTPWTCAAQGGVKGQGPPNCTMTPAQITQSGTALGSSGCGSLMMWRFDSLRQSNVKFPPAFKSVADLQKQRAVTPCVVRP